MIRRTWIRSLAGFALVTALTPLALAQDDEGADTIEIREVQLGTSLEEGLVTEPQTEFSRADGRIYAVIRLNNPSREAGSIRVALQPADGPDRRGFALDIPARPRYRTVARFGATHPPGDYRIVIRTEDGTELESVSLTITE